MCLNNGRVRAVMRPLRCKFAKQNGGREAELKGALRHNITYNIGRCAPNERAAKQPVRCFVVLNIGRAAPNERARRARVVK